MGLGLVILRSRARGLTLRTSSARSGPLLVYHQGAALLLVLPLAVPGLAPKLASAPVLPAAPLPANAQPSILRIFACTWITKRW
jgi:hypothetical protein